MADRAPRSWVIPTAVQRSVRFVVGIAGVIFELAIRHGEPRWQALAVCTAFAGLPIANLGDDVRARISPPSPPPEDSTTEGQP